MRRLSQLDGIRGFAIAAVLADHLGSIIGLGISRNPVLLAIDNLMLAGWLGVDVFFVLSGFLITGIILKDRSEPGFWSNFYLRRAFRILPAFAVIFTITLVAAHYFAPQIHVTSGYVLPAIFFLANWTAVTQTEMPWLGHIWSLAVEEQFYFLWPQAAKRLNKVTLLKLALALVVASELLRVLLAVIYVRGEIIFKITPTRIDGLSIGAALAVGITLPEVQRFLANWWRRIAIVAAALLCCIFFAFHGSLAPISKWSQIFAIPPAIVLTSMLIFGALESALPSGLARFFGNPVMTYLGRRSYALYLIHGPLRVAVQASRVHGTLANLPQGVGVDILLVLSILVISLILSELSWRLIEMPAQNLRHRLMRKKEDGTPGHLPEEEVIVRLAEESQ
ncbi:acyltransferase family protein [Acidicapsa ligni]|uniref:acyltransferase family protein n=1 Tax=Acidicapsa ligni TaxID=542300 RepID=UPI0021DFD052|nr:acyltransferase [Acidicapsa ligni]